MWQECVCAVTYFQTDGHSKQSSEGFQNLKILSHSKEQAQELPGTEGERQRNKNWWLNQYMGPSEFCFLLADHT